jgi:hypothetical protein
MVSEIIKRQRYHRQAAGWLTKIAWFDSLEGRVIFSCLNIHTGCVANSASGGIKRPGRETDHSHPLRMSGDIPQFQRMTAWHADEQLCFASSVEVI